MVIPLDFYLATDDMNIIILNNTEAQKYLVPLQITQYQVWKTSVSILIIASFEGATETIS